MSIVVRRVVLALLTVSAAALVGLKQSEGFEPRAMQPVPGDEWTYGHGSTIKADGSPVRPGDSITRVEAHTLMSKQLASNYERIVKNCAGDILVTQGEYDALIDLAYHIGAGRVCMYSIVKLFRAGWYEDGCKSILTIDKLNGVHCAVPENRKKVVGCNGIMNRREKQFRTCMGAK